MGRKLNAIFAGVAAAGSAPPAESGAIVEAAAPQAGARFVPKPAAESADGATGLPHSQAGQRFATLDAYLTHLRAGGAIDRPWYEEVAPGLYELRTSIRPAPAGGRRYRRAELERMFGFTQAAPR